MALAPGTRLGTYEITGRIGAGGMGEVYRAHDPRLRRDVALKVLHGDVADDPDRLRRFEQEARAAAALNHPNILAIFDVGAENGSPYVVSELLDGVTLREMVSSGALSLRKALDFAIQIGSGLAAAHAQGIVHRDLKPENVLVTKDGRAKILDFGLAKLVESGRTENTGGHLPTISQTEPGLILGTAGYMAPEQVRGEPIDHRADIFAFGALLYELLSGRRAFGGSSPMETITSVLRDEPPPLKTAPLDVPASLDRLVRRCLEKSPDHRFQSAKDLVFTLESLSADSGVTAASAVIAAPTQRLRWVTLLLLVGLVATGVATGFWWGRSGPARSSAAFQRLTFRRGSIQSAKFSPDGQTIVYGAAWQGAPSELFSTRAGSSEARRLDLTRSTVLSISSSGEMALRLPNGTLARVPLAGGAPRELVENGVTASWGPDGKTLAIVRRVGDRRRLEFPAGKVLYETANLLDNVSISANGSLVFCSEATPGIGSTASVIAVDLNGNKQLLSDGWRRITGLAWSERSNEVWFSATKTSIGGEHLLGVSRNRVLRELAPIPGSLILHDISMDGRVLVARTDTRLEAAGKQAGDTAERDLSWLDFSGLSDLSDDGGTLIITEDGEAGFRTFLRKMSDSTVLELGEGGAFTLSPDGRSVILQPTDPPRLVILPTGPGEPKPVAHHAFTSYQWANWFPDGKRIMFVASEAGHALRPYVQDLDGGSPKPIADEGILIPTGSHALSPDGSVFAGIGSDRRTALYPIDGGAPRTLPTLTPGDLPIRWSGDGRFLYVYRQGRMPAAVLKLEVASGTKESWLELGPADRGGVAGVGHVLLTPDGRSYAYNYMRILSDLYVIDGVK